ncbi:UDP-N-acetylmuramate dehydrogenase [Hyphobacterium sp. HN65]|uniref:UDP-N-acetylenolpyruvoylglucosamine reductase n=1 Tax=Hyphobacterium lacteum TaxID=3116575 RepID=A0ABU7LSK0_9PROT|nr:UDP-N-acetylmuramate dehydrogenase [Hyphobacterium sp. HN65]MEE2526319.1 UDP-N-acetylmuramate dehydrogenase [Hyphobacterium sp. HN65]
MSLTDRLPPVRGKYLENAPLADMTWLRVGGPAEVLFLPADEADLANFLAETPDDIPVHILGAGSNTLVRDGGVPGVVIRVTAPFGKVEAIGGNRLKAGAAALDKKVAQAAAKAGIAGLEFFTGVPGAIGGAIRMNAGCYGTETCDVLVEAVALDRMGRRLIIQPEELGYAYRHSEAPDDWIFVEATFEGKADDPAAIEARMAQITARREQTQPIREKTSGSTFKNPDPPGTPDQRKAWKLIDQTGWRGKKIGGACFSRQHANFLINDGTASAADLEAVAEGARADIKAATGIDLHWEVRRIGVETSS